MTWSFSGPFQDRYWLLILVFPEVPFKITLLKFRIIPLTTTEMDRIKTYSQKRPIGCTAVWLNKVNREACFFEVRLILQADRWIVARWSILLYIFQSISEVITPHIYGYCLVLWLLRCQLRHLNVWCDHYWDTFHLLLSQTACCLGLMLAQLGECISCNVWQSVLFLIVWGKKDKIACFVTL